MKTRIFLFLFSILLSIFCLGISLECLPAYAQEIDPLPSWNEGINKQAILDFVQDVSNNNSPNFVPIEDRIATFDNDGTLWAEKPLYFQEFFILDRIGSLLASLPKKTLSSLTEADIMLEDLNEYNGLTTDDYKNLANTFLHEKVHPDFGVPYINLTYKPLIELLDYLRENDFKIFICSGGGIDFIRSFAEEAYGIPPENVIGSSIQTVFQITPNGPVLIRQPKLVEPFNDKAGKPVGIERYIGKRPIMAVGNSTGDLQMLQYTDDRKGHDLMMLVHHDDKEREYKYDEKAVKALIAAKIRGWNVISMKDDFKTIFSGL